MSWKHSGRESTAKQDIEVRVRGSEEVPPNLSSVINSAENQEAAHKKDEGKRGGDRGKSRATEGRGGRHTDTERESEERERYERGERERIEREINILKS